MQWMLLNGLTQGNSWHSGRKEMGRLIMGDGKARRDHFEVMGSLRWRLGLDL